MSKNSLSFLTSYFLITPAITALPPPYQPNAPTLPITPLALLFYHVEEMIKEARARAKILREDAEREVIAIDAVAVRPFGDADESLLAGRRQKYRLEKPDRILVRLKVEHSRFSTLKNQRLVSKSVEEVANPSDSELRSLTKSGIFYISVK